MFFDELDSIAKSRGGSAGDGGRLSIVYIILLMFIIHLLIYFRLARQLLVCCSLMSWILLRNLVVVMLAMEV